MDPGDRVTMAPNVDNTPGDNSGKVSAQLEEGNDFGRVDGCNTQRGKNSESQDQVLLKVQSKNTDCKCNDKFK